jgi:gliding motility-associated-like protein
MDKINFVKYDLTIFDRWGGMMFRGNDLESNNLSQGWDGKSKGKFVSSGVYAFMINIKDIDYTVNGTVAVIY